MLGIVAISSVGACSRSGNAPTAQATTTVTATATLTPSPTPEASTSASATAGPSGAGTTPRPSSSTPHPSTSGGTGADPGCDALNGVMLVATFAVIATSWVMEDEESTPEEKAAKLQELSSAMYTLQGQAAAAAGLTSNPAVQNAAGLVATFVGIVGAAAATGDWSSVGAAFSGSAAENAGAAMASICPLPQ